MAHLLALRRVQTIGILFEETHILYPHVKIRSIPIGYSARINRLAHTLTHDTQNMEYEICVNPAENICFLSCFKKKEGKKKERGSIQFGKSLFWSLRDLSMS